MNRRRELFSLKREEIFLYLETILFYFSDLTSTDLLHLASISLVWKQSSLRTFNKNLYNVVRKHRLQPKGCFCI